jgi:hypothetical protein
MPAEVAVVPHNRAGIVMRKHEQKACIRGIIDGSSTTKGPALANFEIQTPTPKNQKTFGSVAAGNNEWPRRQRE